MVTALTPSAEVDRKRLMPSSPDTASSTRFVIDDSTSEGDAPG